MSVMFAIANLEARYKSSDVRAISPFNVHMQPLLVSSNRLN